MPTSRHFAGRDRLDVDAVASASRVRWRVLALMMAAGAVGYILRINLSTAAPAIKSELGLTETELGVVLSAFVTTYAIGQIPGGFIGERLGARRVMTVLFSGWAAVTLLIGLLPTRAVLAASTTFGLLLLLRGVMGLLQAPLFPVTCGGTTRVWFPKHQWAFANAVQNAAYTLASASAAPVLVWVLLRFGWRMTFVAGAPLALVLAAWWWWDTRDNPADHPGVNRAELRIIRAGSVDVPKPGSTSWRAVAMNRDLALVTASYFCLHYVYYLFFNWFYYYLTEVRDVPAQMAGYFTGAQWLVAAVASLAGGVLCD
jgi:ACS family glucarate transporter-like MFS transporter